VVVGMALMVRVRGQGCHRRGGAGGGSGMGQNFPFFM
jgi:hypothetical protein